jgi:hypothetical protein
MDIYGLILTESSTCVHCNEPVWLLSPETFNDRLPAFYICFHCQSIGQVGVGPVTARDEAAAPIQTRHLYIDELRVRTFMAEIKPPPDPRRITPDRPKLGIDTIPEWC